MKRKLTILMFGLLLAVGWTASAQAQALPEGILKATKKSSAPTMMSASNTGQSATMSAPLQEPTRVTGVSSVVKAKSYYQQFKYSWTDESTGETHTNVDPTEPASNPYQIYELLRFIYGNPNFPGPTYSAYLPNLQREDPVYYGAIAGGWNISVGSGAAAPTTYDLTITASSYYASFKSITVYDMNDNVLTRWDADEAIDNGEYTDFTYNGTTYYRYTLPGWSSTDYFRILNVGTSDDPIMIGYLVTDETTPGSITIPYTLLNGQTEVKVVINANHDWETGNEGSSTQTLTVSAKNSATQTLTSDFADYTWNNVSVYEAPQQNAFVQGTVVAPGDDNDGYTVVLVALKDRPAGSEGSTNPNLETELWPANSTHFEQKSQLISYFSKNIEYVRLLTDGLRIGSETDHTSGTVFNADGRLNRFFFLGKGQARKKAPRILDFISRGRITFDQFTANGQNYTTVNYQDWFGEDVPFEEMFEQFSPTSTTVSEESQTTDLFDKLREGNVYSVQHDCGSVMQAEHEFSLSGKYGTEHYPFSGLNFFVPDYRLLYWYKTEDGYTVDGRDNVPYQSTNTSTGAHGSYFSGIYDTSTSGWNSHNVTWYSAWSAYYAVYNPTYAPKLGIYKITLDATATQVADSHDPDNQNFLVTLTWVSSLDQMSGTKVPQIYTIYLIDNETGERIQLTATGVTNPTGETTVSYYVPQGEHSYTIDYIIHGTPNDDDHPAFEAWSNPDGVIIPGWEDFVGLKLDHHESDFVISNDSRDNYYRNFLAMINEDIYNGLTISKITGYNEANPANPLTPMNTFNLYRYEFDDNGEPKDYIKVATVTFDQATADQVHYTITYDNQVIENYTLKYKDGNQTITVPNAYELENLDVPVSGWVRVKGNGDIVIWPNRYSVNIKSITIKNGNNTITSWNASSADFGDQDPNLPTSPYRWATSPGSKFLPYTTSTTNEKVCYMEGGGYLYIPGILNDYPNATIVIEAFGEAGNVNRITVNDAAKNIEATAGGTTYTWGGSNDPVSPNAAPKRDNNGSRKDVGVKNNTSTNDINRR